MITSLVSNKGEWNIIVLLNPLNPKSLEVPNTSEKKGENPSEIEKSFMKMRCCVIP